MIENFTLDDGGGWINWGFIINEMYKACVFFLPALVCLLVVGFCLWIINYIYGGSWRSRYP